MAAADVVAHFLLSRMKLPVYRQFTHRCALGLTNAVQRCAGYRYSIQDETE